MLARERELDDLRAQLEASNEEQATVQIELERLQGDLERKRAMSLDLSRTHAQRAGAQASAQAERERLAKRVGTLQASQKSVAEDLARVNVELAKTEPEVVELGQAIEALRVSRTDAEERMSDISGARAIAYEREQSLSSKLSESKLEFATAKERSLSLTREHRERVRDLERAQHAKERAERDLVVLDVASKRIEPVARRAAKPERIGHRMGERPCGPRRRSSRAIPPRSMLPSTRRARLRVPPMTNLRRRRRNSMKSALRRASSKCR